MTTYFFNSHKFLSPSWVGSIINCPSGSILRIYGSTDTDPKETSTDPEHGRRVKDVENQEEETTRRELNEEDEIGRKKEGRIRLFPGSF